MPLAPVPAPLDSAWVTPLWLTAAFVAAGSATLLTAAVTGAFSAARREGHWSERARRRWPSMNAVAAFGVAAPLAFGVISALRTFDPPPLPARLFGLLSGLSALSGAAVASIVVARRTRALPPSIVQCVRSWIVTATLFRVAPLAVLLGVAVMPPRPGPLTLVVVALVGILIVAMGAGGATRLLVLLGIAKPASDDVRAMVERAAARAGTSVGSVVVVESEHANAAVFPIPRDVLVLRPVLDFPREEIEAIFDHEAGHLAESRIVAWWRLVPGLAFTPLAAVVPVTTGISALAGMTLGLLAISLSWLGTTIARRLEVRADAHASDVESHGEDEAARGAYARALTRLAEVNLIPAVGWAKGTHPHLYDRLVAVGHEPDFARPAPPSRARMWLGLLCGVAWFVTVMQVARSLLT